MIKIPISGGPHSGKSTLFEALKIEYPTPDTYFVPEAAEQVIRRELGKQALDPTYKAIVPWDNYAAFAPVVVQESVELEQGIPKDAKLVFLDRSLIDNLGYARLDGLESLIPEVERKVRAAQYTFALFCEPVGEYTTTEVRRETAEKARQIRDHLAETYNSSGLYVEYLPPVSVEERLATIQHMLTV